MTIDNFEGILLIISLINGKMGTPKIHSLNALIDFYTKIREQVFKNSKYQICYEQLQNRFYLRSFTRILQVKNIRYGPIKYESICEFTLSFNNFFSLKVEF